MDDTKEALPVVAWSYVPSAAWADVVYTYDPEKVKLARECGCEVTQLTDHATATAAIAELRAEVERLKADAERYRWLKNNPEWLGLEHDFRPDEVEREIDATRSGAYGVAE